MGKINEKLRYSPRRRLQKEMKYLFDFAVVLKSNHNHPKPWLPITANPRFWKEFRYHNNRKTIQHKASIEHDLRVTSRRTLRHWMFGLNKSGQDFSSLFTSEKSELRKHSAGLAKNAESIYIRELENE